MYQAERVSLWVLVGEGRRQGVFDVPPINVTEILLHEWQTE